MAAVIEGKYDRADGDVEYEERNDDTTHDRSVEH
jgi:hypothetical protein